MPYTVSEAAWYAVTDVLFATRPGTIQTCAFICSTRGDGCFYYTTEKCKEKPMIWDEIKED